MLRDLDCFQIPYEISEFGDKVIQKKSEYDESTCAQSIVVLCWGREGPQGE